MSMLISSSMAGTLAPAFGNKLNGGTVVFYDGAVPASLADAVTGNTLATLTLPSPAFTVVSAGVITANAIAAVFGDITGAPTFFRSFDSLGVEQSQDLISTVTLSTASITAGAPVAITDWTLTFS